MKKQKGSRSKQARDLGARKVPNKTAKDVRGGAYQAYTTVEGTKQGKFKGGSN